MFEDLKKTLEKGLDSAFMSAEKLAQSARELAKEHNLTKEDAKKLYDYLAEKSEEARKTVEHEIQEAVKNTLKKLDVPTREEYDLLAARLKKLEARRPAPARKKPGPAKPAGKAGKK